MIQEFQESHDELRVMAKQNILKMQEDNKKTYNRKYLIVRKCRRSDLVFTKQIQFGPKLKLKQKYLGHMRYIEINVMICMR
jgi:hypothetical protein